LAQVRGDIRHALGFPEAKALHRPACAGGGLVAPTHAKQAERMNVQACGWHLLASLCGWACHIEWRADLGHYNMDATARQRA